MHFQTILQLVKKDFQKQKWLLICALLIPLLLEMLLIWQSDRIASWFPYASDDDKNGFTSIIAVVLLVLPYLIIFLSQMGRTSREQANGFYPFLRLMPVRPEELVTAKFVSAFCITVGAGIWYGLLWFIHVHGSNLMAESNVWGTLFAMGLFYSIFIAVNLGVFFRSGAKEGSVMIFVFLIVIFASQQDFGKAALSWMNDELITHPTITLTIGVVILLAVWLICWRWAKHAYSEYLLREGMSWQEKELDL